MSRPAWIAAIAALGLALGGCGKTVNEQDMERDIANDLAKGVRVKAKVDCPDGQEAEKGTKFACRATVGKASMTVDVTMTSETAFTYRPRWR